jgi:Uma2 family endonuclease
MALATPPPTAHLLTYEEYMAAPATKQRYEILDGIRYDMTNPNRRHQKIQFRIASLLDDFGRTSGVGEMIIAASDILISRTPLRTRQPDVLFMSRECVAANPPDTDATPLNPAPELVVEILSRSDYRRVLNDKLADYCKVSVRECWVVTPEAATIEVLRLSADGPETVDIYRVGQSLQSLTFPALTLPVADVFSI